jgi:diadenosine tetraphosphate (Ap4A) HIT family hydrolase
MDLGRGHQNSTRTDAMTEISCPLCRPLNENLLWRDAILRIIRVDDPDYPGFCRVILNRHVKEMTDLPPDERAHLMQSVFVVEGALRELMQPDKVNLAALGNQVPHLHWHVIPRFADDAHFPDPVWAVARRPGQAHPVDATRLARIIGAALAR